MGYIINQANCSECDAVNQALKDKAKWQDLQMHTMEIHVSKDGTLIEMFDVDRCSECKGIFSDLYVTSEK